MNYDFREKYCDMHTPIAKEDGHVTICCKSGGEVIATAIDDFCDFLKKAFGKSCSRTERAGDINVVITTGNYMQRHISIKDGDITVTAADERGAAQALYFIEHEMKLNGTSVLPDSEHDHAPQFSPRMIHSGVGMDFYPDSYLSAAAHYGYDAILVYVRDATHSHAGECDFNDLISRAARYGIDVYAYCAVQNFVHPDDKDAKKIYTDLYGGIFSKNPGFAGIVFVGESVEFPSRDPHVECRAHTQPPADGIPTGKPTPGWWPCYDYVDWISLVRDSIRAVKSTADVVFWTYNFGYVDKEYRLALINNLPTDITLLVTYEMFEKLDLGNSIGAVSDYTISFVGPGEYFKSEAEVAKARGIKLYSMTNTAGRTWDFGVIPYEPFAFQWDKRNQSVLESKEKYGLCGLMESHHYGFLPSFISVLANGSFTKGTPSFEQRFKRYCEYISPDYAQTVYDGLYEIDRAITYYVPSNENQYGPFRIGPAYPFCLKRSIKKPDHPDAVYGNSIYKTLYIISDTSDKSPYSIRIHDEMRRNQKAIMYLRKGRAILNSVHGKSHELKSIINLVDYIICCFKTALNHRRFYLASQQMLISSDINKIYKLADRITKIANEEIRNAKKAVKYVEYDSAIGYESSMSYSGDKEAILWKIKHMNYMLEHELKPYKRPITDARSVNIK